MALCPRGHEKTRWRTSPRRKNGWYDCDECRNMRNNARFRPKGRPRGDNAANVKISEKGIERMRFSHSRGVTYTQLGRIYNMHPDTVGRLVRGTGRVKQREGTTP